MKLLIEFTLKESYVVVMFVLMDKHLLFATVQQMGNVTPLADRRSV